MTQIAREPVGLDRQLTVANVRRWLDAHGAEGMRDDYDTHVDPQILLERVAEAFGVEDLVAGLEPGDHWLCDEVAQAAADLQCELDDERGPPPRREPDWDLAYDMERDR